MPKTKETRRDKKDSIVFAYLNKELSRKLASAMLRDLKYEEWQVNLFLDDDQTGPE